MAIKTPLFILLLAASAAGPVFCAGPEINPQNAQAEELSSVRDRLMTSLFFRGELADKIMEAGQEGRFVSLDGIETNAEARSALLDWIRKNPGKAAEVYLNIKGAGGRLNVAIETRETLWSFKPALLEVIKALNDAAGSSSVSRETLESAARHLYEGKQAAGEAPEVRAGGAGSAGTPGGGNFFSIDYADYRLNTAGLGKEVAQAGAWLEAARGGLRPGLGGAYSTALSLYSEFVVAASALKGREAVTGQEAARLESLRVKLRAAMAALALRARITALADAAASLQRAAGQPGAEALLLSVSRLKAGLEALAGRIEAGGATLRELGGLVNSAENDFAAFYLGYSAYDGLLSLKSRAAGAGFSCFYDYVFYRYLAVFFPKSIYPAARAALASAAGELDAALLKAGGGDLEGALSGFDARRAEAAAGVVRSASAFNRGAQFFLWGLLFRPVEYKVSVRNGRAFFRPALTFYEVAGKK